MSFLLTNFFMMEGSCAQKYFGVKEDSLLIQLSKVKRIESEHIVWAGSLSENCKIAKRMWLAYPDSILVKFTDNENPFVRCYAFVGLVELQADKKMLENIITKHSNDSALVATMRGCLIAEESVFSFMKNYAQFHLLDEEQKRKNLEIRDIWLNPK